MYIHEINLLHLILYLDTFCYLVDHVIRLRAVSLSLQNHREVTSKRETARSLHLAGVVQKVDSFIKPSNNRGQNSENSP